MQVKPIDYKMSFLTLQIAHKLNNNSYRENKEMSRRSLRSGAVESVRSPCHSQESPSRSRWEMEDASSVCSRRCYCGNVVKTHTSWTVSHLGRRFQVCARVSLFLCKVDLKFGIFVDSNCDAAPLCNGNIDSVYAEEWMYILGMG
ncbi:unnamed protein product [Prunus brigantina]